MAKKTFTLFRRSRHDTADTVFQRTLKIVSGLTVVGIAVVALLTISVVISSARDVNAAQYLPPGDNALINRIIDDARQSAKKPYQEAENRMDNAIRTMSYQQYRAIRFKAEHSLWRNAADFEAQFFHPGFLYTQPVAIYDVTDNGDAVKVGFQPGWFRYDDTAAPLAGLAGKQTGFAGFRLHYPINTPDYKDEFAVFLGASYFRLIGERQVYGLSARALAIDTGLATGEEFPHFTSFWLNRHAESKSVTIYARLESKSLSATYEFVITPGKSTRVAVKSWLFARQDIAKLGLAPFTSMFLYGENTPKQLNDYRPEVHDSDGLLMQTGSGEWIWRPLTNPQHLQITSLSDASPQGFGLLQRDALWEHYLDAEARYHRRPGLWVTPQAGFGRGRLELVEIPTQSETNDNIVAYWVPDKPVKEGDALYVAYEIKTTDSKGVPAPLAKVQHTRFGATVLPGDEERGDKAKQRVVVDFEAPEGLTLPATATLTISASNGSISEKRLYPVNGGKAWRATFLFSRRAEGAVDMRLHIDDESQRLSEVWNYVYQ